MARTNFATTALLLLFGCDAAVVAQTQTRAEADAEVAAAVDAQTEVAVVAVAPQASASIELAADSFKLAEVTALVQGGTIETAEELELAVNDPEAGINRIDIDADGHIDHVEVIEVRGDAQVDFQMKVIPSSRATILHGVDLATATVMASRATSEVSFSASFSAGVHFSAGAAIDAHALAFVAPAHFEASAVVVAQPLLAWAFVVDRPIYHSVYVEAGTGRWVPPGHRKHGHWKATGGLPPGHVKGHGGGKFEGHAGFGGGGHGSGKGHGHAEFGGGGKGHGGGKFEGHVGGKHESKGHGGKHGFGGASAPKQSSHGGSPKAGGPKGGGPKQHAGPNGGGGSKGGGSKGGGAKGGGKGKK